MQLLITGDNGFIGKYLKAKHPDALSLQGIRLDESDRLCDFLKEHCVTQVVHLAGQAFVPEAFKDPINTFNVNFLGTFNLLQALKLSGFTGRFLFISSGDVYGHVETLPILESFLPKPRNPYAVSKIAAENLCYQWSQIEPFEIIIARLFNTIGPGQNDRFAIANFAKQIKENVSVIEIGDPSVSRDFTDVRDVVLAFEHLLKFGKNGEIYNICSGIERKLIDAIEMMKTLCQSEAKIESLEKNIRKGEQKRVVGSNRKIYQDTGWSPKIGFEETLRDILQLTHAAS